MTIYTERPLTLDARLFSGGQQLGEELAAWVNGGQPVYPGAMTQVATWMPAEDEVPAVPAIPEIPEEQDQDGNITVQYEPGVPGTDAIPAKPERIEQALDGGTDWWLVGTYVYKPYSGYFGTMSEQALNANWVPQEG